jgi:hypothetical protein
MVAALNAMNVAAQDSADFQQQVAIFNDQLEQAEALVAPAGFPEEDQHWQRALTFWKTVTDQTSTHFRSQQFQYGENEYDKFLSLWQYVQSRCH